MAESDGKRRRDHRIFSLLHLLAECAPDSPVAKKSFEAFQKKHPEFAPIEADDFGTRPSGVTTISAWSPVTVDELLSKPPSDWLSQIQEYRAEARRSVKCEGFMENAVKAASKELLWGVTLGELLLISNVLDFSVWSGLVHVWAEAALDTSIRRRVIRLLEAPALIEALPHPMSNLLWHWAEKHGSDIAGSMLDETEDLAETLWDSLVEEDDDCTYGNDWLMSAINHAGGQLILYWLYMARHQLVNADGKRSQIPAKYRYRFQEAISGTSLKCQLARIVLASQFHYLLSLDTVWTREQLLPLLNWDRNRRTAEQVWHGFLGWGRLRDDLLPEFRPLYLQAAEHLPAEPARMREQLVHHLADVALSVRTGEQDYEWLDSVIRILDERKELVSWVQRIRFRLRDLNEKQKIHVWDTFLGDYWRRRKDGIPIQIREDEMAQMYRWVVELAPVYEKAVDLVIQSPKADPGRISIYRRMKEDGLVETHASPTAVFLMHLLESSKYPLSAWLCSDVLDVIELLNNQDISRDSVEKMCNLAVGLGCPGASDLYERLK